VPSGPLSHSEPPPFFAALKAERGAVVQALSPAIKERVAYYRDVPESDWLASVDGLAGVFLDALGDHRAEAVRAWTRQRLERSEVSEFSLEAMFETVSIVRDHLMARARAAVEERAPGAWEAVCVFAAVRDEIASALVEFSIGRAASASRAQTEVEAARRETEERYRVLVERSPLAILVHQGGVVVYANPSALRLFGAQVSDELVGTKVLDRIHPDDRATVIERVRRMTHDREQAPPVLERFLRIDGRSVPVEVTALPIIYQGTPAIQVVCADISERMQTEEALRRSAVQEEVIRTQEAMLRALSTPLIPMGDGVVVMPLVGRIDEARAARILEALLEGVAAHRAGCAILDVTGVPEVDAAAASGLLRAARSVRLLGASIVLTGLTPALATTLVEMGIDLGDVETRGTLKDGLAHAMRSGLRR
jgi:rsbT co-antagonist protein RsbR